MNTVTVMYAGRPDPGIVQQLGKTLRRGDVVDVPIDKVGSLPSHSFYCVDRDQLVEWAEKYGQPVEHDEPEAAAYDSPTEQGESQ